MARKWIVGIGTGRMWRGLIRRNRNGSGRAGSTRVGLSGLRRHDRRRRDARRRELSGVEWHDPLRHAQSEKKRADRSGVDQSEKARPE